MWRETKILEAELLFVREMSAATRDFVQKLFLEYYTERFEEVAMPHKFEKREFAALLLKEKAMVRHRMFKSALELQDFLCSILPSDVYYSSACYEQPAAPEMNAKGWTGADLIFDIDADHIPTPCDKIHDEWVCGKCEFVGKGVVPEKCPCCGGEKFEDNTWPCEICLASAKIETIKLLDMLTEDFGFSNNEIRVFFSGHRGYHVHVENEAVQTLDAVARKEIVDYLCSLGFDSALHGLDEKNLRTLNTKNIGWRGRVAKRMFDFVSMADSEDYSNMGLKGNVIDAIVKNKDSLLKSWSGSEAVAIARGVGPETWRKLVEHSVESSSAKIDTVVTIDTHRLIRLPGTLHGKTGFKEIEFPMSYIDDFDPFTSAIAFKGGVTTVFVSDAPEFRLGEERYGPYKNQKVELPTAAALFLVCKKRAEVVA